MTNMTFSSPMLIVLILFLLSQYVVAADTQRKVYIVFMDEQPTVGISMESIHLNVLEQVLEGSLAKESLIYSYGKSFNGFAASLTDRELKKLSGMKGVLSVFPSRTLQLHTTRSWDFLNFPTTVKRLPAIESDVVVGVIDSGIWPESESFNDKGMGPPPSKWKGVCQNITCNNKLIGARFYKADHDFPPEEEESPRDTLGHGTHTASTAAGREVGNTSLYGLAEGTVRGAVPSARIAVYKVCWGSSGCTSQDILAAFDDAIDDGVDILSVSLGAVGAIPYDADPIAVGAFHALKKGILTSASAGNDGPSNFSITNVAPWVLTVAASSTDRRIISNVALGSGKTFVGHAINTFPTSKTFSPLVIGRNEYLSFCYGSQLNKTLVKGKIILCPFPIDGSGPLLSGAKGTVIVTDNRNDTAFSFPLPATIISTADGDTIESDFNSTRNLTANIQKSEAIRDPNAPFVASFSSRGPNVFSRGILKPDITAPGVDILAAWSPKGKVSSYSGDKRSVGYSIISGTSMSCPHATGAAAYVKTFHPNWSPAAIKSALMTTASPMKSTIGTDNEFAYGAGQIDPVKAVDPGLVYDTEESDYIQMLCDSGYTTERIRIFTQQNTTCSKSKGTDASLNYPSLTANVTSNKIFSANFPRTVTNVGSENSTYKVKISQQRQLNITVTPNVLSFKSLNEKQNFIVKISGEALPDDSVISAWLSWSDGVHIVRSPIVVWRGEIKV